MDSVAFGNILYISRALRNFQRQLRLDEPLMPQEMLFISFIHRHPGCTQDQIVRFTGMDKTTVAHRLNKLEEKGYVRREIDADDARRRLCSTTEKADAAYPAIHALYTQFKEAVLADFSAEDLQLIDRMTSRMKENAERLVAEKPAPTENSPATSPVKEARA